jgi:DNA repair protein RecN (Recombination protein N)
MNAHLVRLTVDDFALIAHAELGFAPGLTIVTGETGSGKTMLLGALDFALGARNGAEVVRTGAARARATLEVAVDDALRATLDDAGFALDDGEETAIFFREMTAAGRSQARVNGVPATVGQVRALATAFVEFVGQHEAQRLLAAAYQRDVLDRFGGAPLLAARGDVAELVARRDALDAEIAERERGDARAEAEFARFARDEIAALAPEAGEDDRIRERRDYLANVERIAAALRAAQTALDDDGGAVDAIGGAARALAGVERYDAELGALARSLASLQEEAADAAVRVSRALDATEFDPSELDAATERLAALDRLKRKYGGSLEAVLQAKMRYDDLADADAQSDERLLAAQRERAHVDDALARAAASLSALRTAAGDALAQAVDAELGALAMPAARFGVRFEPLDAIGAGGAERCEFTLAPNPGESARALARSASGGELSRVLLALVVAADRRAGAAFVFDEIDAGIGGATAVAVGARLGRLARETQAVCVTHLAQIASWADAHYALRKREAGGGVTIALEPLEEEPSRLHEIARMLSGDARDVSLDHAATLVADVAEHRRAVR